jgi:Flp pilus assembly protein CpaB
VVAARVIQAGERITGDAITVQSVPGTALLEGRFANLADVEGQVATSPIFPGEQVTISRLTDVAGADTLAFKVPAGMRALALEVPHESWIAAGLPQPGDRVDILGIATLVKVDPLTGEERPDLAGAYLAQNVEILAVAQTIVKSVTAVKDPDAVSGTDGTPGAEASSTVTPEDGTGAVDTETTKSQDSGQTFQTAVSITLALDPELAAKIAMIDAIKDDQAQYRLLVRQKGDGTEVTGPITWSWEDIFPDQ